MATENHRLSANAWIAIVLSAIGAINWGLIGLFGFDLVAVIFGEMSVVSRIVYVIVGVAGVYLLARAATRLRSERRMVRAPTSGVPTT